MIRTSSAQVSKLSLAPTDPTNLLSTNVRTNFYRRLTESFSLRNFAANSPVDERVELDSFGVFRKMHAVQPA